MLLLAMSVFVSADVLAKALADAVAAMRTGDFAETYCIMRPLADADAQYNEHAALFGIKRQVKANKLNARKGPSVKEEVVAKLLKGRWLLEMHKQGKWSQVAVLDEAGQQKDVLNQTVWVYNPLLEDVESAAPDPASQGDDQ